MFSIVTVRGVEDVAALQVQDAEVDDHHHGHRQLQAEQHRAESFAQRRESKTAFQRIGWSIGRGKHGRIEAGHNPHAVGNQEHGQHQRPVGHQSHAARSQLGCDGQHL